jgi:DNA-binding beta-propeller fold protein YncE
VGGVLGRTTTRRRFVGAVATVGAVRTITGVARADDRAPEACTPRPPAVRRAALAVAPDGKALWVADTGSTTITAYAPGDLAPQRTIDVGEAPVDLAVAPDGAQALVAAGFYDRPGLVVVDLAAGAVADRVDVGRGARAVAYAPGGHVAYVVGGTEHGWLRRVDLRTGRAGAPVDIGSHPRGMAIVPGGARAVVALNGAAAVAVVDLSGPNAGAVRRIATAPFPYLVAVTPDGHRAFVSHNGFGDTRVTPLDLRRLRAARPWTTGLDPAGLALTGSGRVLAVAERGRGTVALHDARTGRRTRRIRVGDRPRAVAIRGRRAFVLDGETGRVAAVEI